MKSDCFYKCSLYKWNKENLKLSKAMYSHICHHINNDLAVIVGTLLIMKKGSVDTAQLDLCMEKVMEIAEYINDIKEFRQEDFDEN